jgi:hypothetical protein
MDSNDVIAKASMDGHHVVLQIGELVRELPIHVAESLKGQLEAALLLARGRRRLR